MQIEDGFLQHLSSYRIDGFPLDDIHHLTRARSTRRITVPNAACGLGVRSSAIAVERPLLPALASSGKDCQPPPKALYRATRSTTNRRLALRQQYLIGEQMSPESRPSGRVHLLVGLSLNSIPSGKSGPTGMNCSSTRFSFERGRLLIRARAPRPALPVSREKTPLPPPRVAHACVLS